MVKCGRTVIAKAIQYINLNQVPVIAVDQPLYSLAKQIQWTWVETKGEDKFLIMFGGLHIDITTFCVLVSCLQDIG